MEVIIIIAHSGAANGINKMERDEMERISGAEIAGNVEIFWTPTISHLYFLPIMRFDTETK